MLAIVDVNLFTMVPCKLWGRRRRRKAWLGGTGKGWVGSGSVIDFISKGAIFSFLCVMQEDGDVVEGAEEGSHGAAEAAGEGGEEEGEWEWVDQVRRGGRAERSERGR